MKLALCVVYKIAEHISTVQTGIRINMKLIFLHTNIRYLFKYLPLLKLTA